MDRRPVLVLTSKETEKLITMGECLRAMEDAFWELGPGIAQVIPRRRIITPRPDRRSWHWLNVIPGAVPRFNVAAVRIDSATMTFPEVNGRIRMEFPGHFAGFVLLFDLTTCELLCIYHDHYVSPPAGGGGCVVAVRGGPDVVRADCRAPGANSALAVTPPAWSMAAGRCRAAEAGGGT